MHSSAARIEITNRLLGSLSAPDYRRLSASLRQVHLATGRILYDAGDHADFVYFPLSGVVSLLSSTQAGEMVEVGMIGNEGTTFIPVIAHSQELPYRMLIQAPGEALQCEADLVRDEFIRGGKLHRLLICYAHTLFAQIAQSAVCNRFHSTEARLCRWLLSMDDRVESGVLPLTHEILSNMLGAERAHTSRTAKALQKAELIYYTPGSIEILDRQGLESASCECYQVVKRQVSNCLAA
jgi:CRP-like cAMP-binding protein